MLVCVIYIDQLVRLEPFIFFPLALPIWEAFVSWIWRKCVLVPLCLLLLQTISISLLQPQALMLRLNSDVNSHSALLTKRCRHSNCTCFSLNSNSLSLSFILPCLLFTSSDSVCLNFSPSPSPPPSSPRSLRGEAELGRERLGGRSCHHGGSQTLLPRASWAPGALRLLHRHRGDSQWVTGFSPVQTVSFTHCAQHTLPSYCVTSYRMTSSLIKIEIKARRPLSKFVWNKTK